MRPTPTAPLAGLLLIAATSHAAADDGASTSDATVDVRDEEALEADLRAARKTKTAGMVTTGAGVVSLATAGGFWAGAKSEGGQDMFYNLGAAGLGGLGVIFVAVGVPVWAVAAADEREAERRLQLVAGPGGVSISGAF